MFIYEVGGCPRCGSQHTGRVIKKNTDAMMFSFMGPVIYTPDAKGYTCGCAECGVMWVARPRIRWISLDEYNERNEAWNAEIDGRPTYTLEEEHKIAESLYNEMMGIDEDEKPEKKKSLFGKVLAHEGRALKRQAETIKADFAGIFGIVSDQVGDIEESDSDAESDKQNDDAS